MSNDVSRDDSARSEDSTPANGSMQVDVSTVQIADAAPETATKNVPFEVIDSTASEAPATPPMMVVEVAEEVEVEVEVASELVAEAAPVVEQPVVEAVSDEAAATPEPAEVVAAQTEFAVTDSTESADSPAAPSESPIADKEEWSFDEAAFAEEDAAVSENPFEQMGLSPDVLQAIANAGYETPSEIQAETIPIILANKDIIGQAETGSGKTAAFALPLLSKVDLTASKPQILVLAPTRELALQVTASFEKYAAKMKGFRAVTIYGGQSYETQIRALRRGVQVVVGTPGRVMDHLRRETLDLSGLKTFVLDEADEMLRMGFVDDIEWILDHVPRERHTVMFSATMPDAIRRIARQHLRNPKHITIQSKTATADSIDQMMVFVHPRDKAETLDRILQTEQRDGVLVFTKTRTTTVVVAEMLSQRGYKVAALNGDIPQNQRERTVNQLKSGRIDVVIATDVAARGLDVERISHVINYDFPHDTEAYVHRIGRTGRAGRTGTAILFVEPKEKGKLSRLQRATNQKMSQLKEKSLDDLNTLRIEAFLHKVTAASSHADADMFRKILTRHQREAETTMEDIAAGLAVLAQGSTPLILKELAARRPQVSDDRGGRGGRERGPRRDNADMTTFRVEVGKTHGVGVGNLVGAIANEANLSSENIGRIKLFDEFSLIDLPKDLPEKTVEHLATVYVANRTLQLKPDSGGGGGRSYGGGGGGRRFDNRGGGRKSNNGSTKFGKRFEKKSGDSGRTSSSSSEGRSSYKPSESRSSGGGSERPQRSETSKPPYSSGSKPAYRGSSSSDSKPAYNSGESKPKPSYGGSGSSGSSKPAYGGGSSSSSTSKPSYGGGGSSSSGKPAYAKSKPDYKSKPKASGKPKKPSKRKGGPSADAPARKYVKIRSSK